MPKSEQAHKSFEQQMAVWLKGSKISFGRMPQTFDYNPCNKRCELAYGGMVTKSVWERDPIVALKVH
jgi:hypothetical protein